MRCFILVLALVCAVSAYHKKQSMLETNRVEAEEVESWATSCDECQSIVKKFAKAAEDPTKVKELKMLLNVLCHETSYVEECRMFVSKLDLFLDKLKPYLADAKAVCAKIHLCDNARLDIFRRLLLSMAKRVDQRLSTNYNSKILCDECEFAVKELKQAIEDKELQTEVRDFLRNNVCKALGNYRGFCDLIVDEYLPQFVQELDAVLQDPHQVCVDVKACGASSFYSPRKYIPSVDNLKKSTSAVEMLWKQAGYLTTKNGEQLEMSCFECMMTVDGILEEMVMQRQMISKDIQEFACTKVLPSNMSDSCNNFMPLYLPAVVYMTIKQATGEGVCIAMHNCPPKSVSVYDRMSQKEREEIMCDVCDKVENFVAQHAGAGTVAQFLFDSTNHYICGSALSIFRPLCSDLALRVTTKFARLSAKLASEHQFSHMKRCNL